MSKKKNKKKNVRAEPKGSFLISTTAHDLLCIDGYTRLSDNPEMTAAVYKIADLISSMTIHLMENTDTGDVRVQNELSRKIDINPCSYLTRKSFIFQIVRALLLEGDGNAVVRPKTREGYLEDLIPLPSQQVSFVPYGEAYRIVWNGKTWDPGDMLHFMINPDRNDFWRGTGYRVILKDVVENLRQAAKTKKGFMESKWQPSVIVKVDALTDEFASKDGRKKLMEQYLESNEAGEPWFIPAEQFAVEQVKPLSLTDIALPDSVKLDKRTVAAVLDVPTFIVGEGSFNAEEWNNFINTRIRALCAAIEQELTKKLIIRPDWYFRFNIRSLYAYDIEKLSNVGANMYTRGIMTGNEVRDWIMLPPKEGLDELIILENYIPAGMIGDQKKLNQGGEENA